jgi:GT2 family glycosyltransferase
MGDKEVSVILAVRNEDKYIRRCIISLIQQKFPQEKLEILVIDGKSEDGTLDILREFQTAMPDLITVLDNPKRIAPTGRNIGIKKSNGNYVMILSGHTYVDPDCVQILTKSLSSLPHDVAGIGASFESAEDESLLGKIIGHVQSTLLGGFGSTFRRNAGYVNTSAFTLYRKDVLNSIGLHDENFEMAQDLEINWRIRKAGFKLMLSPNAKVYYYRRHDSFRGLFKRMTKYGLGKAFFIRKHPDSFNISFCIPSGILILILSLLLVNILPDIVYFSILALVACYAAAVATSTFFLCIKYRSLKHVLAAPIYFVEHIAFGIGFLAGLVKRI